jgi:formylglycine-generating enzyme required for sulfatase activity
MSTQRARELQDSGARSRTRTIRFGSGGELELVWIPTGSFVMGSLSESPDERPMAPVRIQEGFWMSTTEIDNRSYRMYDPHHHSRFFTGACETLEPTRMRSLDGGDQPVVRVSWDDAKSFCTWLSQQTGERVDLPTEAEWEWACRSGSDTGFPVWTPGDSAEGIAHCAGVSLGAFHDWKSLAYRVFDRDWDDGTIATGKVDSNKPNAWGLYNMHGNVAEWTRSLYRPYPYREDDGRNDLDADGKRVVRGGSFSDRPKRCTASYRLGYQPWQGVYNVGFRIVIRAGRSRGEHADERSVE